MRHGTRTAYNHHGCRCDECRRVTREYGAQRVAVRSAAALPDHVPHGTAATYSNWGCRCDPCSLAKSIANSEQYAKRKARSH